ncbi:ABC transporter-related protein [Pyrolobus fumarii 1A]|uniref:ABC transporter-related protein n=1 Tax=Pyrolobus fumarii (strain DSM 11204 / 1A) TaxID=694429 RepID=G0EE59_PYRF1|nr:ABC transporter ATP-binding protein [Pyrolobus fumarii]AEM38753.1 ABC transporter-related protein [Pyrolobus fumarii 1A]
MVEVRLVEVSKRFGSVEALKNVTLTFEDGAFTALLGPSGSGKTTLLYIIAGIYKPTSGKVYFGERDVTNLPPNKRNIGLVFQNYALYPHMTVYENIAFPLRLRKLPPSKIDEKVREVAKLLHIEELLDRYPSQLSGGQQQRVAMARALVKEPDVLLLDEPLSNLDALLRVKIRAELKRLQKDLGITTIYVTHDQAEALAMADTVVVIDRGVVQQIGSPDEIYNNPRNLFVATFIGSPPANIITAKVVKRGKEVCAAVGNTLICPDYKIGVRMANLEEVVIAFRPEHAEISEAPLEGMVSFEAEVYAVETLGRENIVTLVVGATPVKVVTKPDVRPQLGSRVYINVPIDKLKYFDPETELNLEYIEVVNRS